MNQKGTDNRTNCKNYRPTRFYTHTQEIIDNVPYFIMTLLGAGLFLQGFGLSFWGWFAAALYIFYSITGVFWIIIFVCPYCFYYGTRSCPCGYGQISAKLLPAQDGTRFMEKFKKHIPFIFPVWFVPLIVGLIFLVREYNILMLILYIFFIINSFIILPLLARKYGCAHCPQKDDCPWMGEKISVRLAHLVKYK